MRSSRDFARNGWFNIEDFSRFYQFGAESIRIVVFYHAFSLTPAKTGSKAMTLTTN
jgi:hypothetical protein